MAQFYAAAGIRRRVPVDLAVDNLTIEVDMDTAATTVTAGPLDRVVVADNTVLDATQAVNTNAATIIGRTVLNDARPDNAATLAVDAAAVRIAVVAVRCATIANGESVDTGKAVTQMETAENTLAVYDGIGRIPRDTGDRHSVKPRVYALGQQVGAGRHPDVVAAIGQGNSRLNRGSSHGQVSVRSSVAAG